jgi:hypothetical protein
MPKLEGEQPDDYDKRTAIGRLHLGGSDGQRVVVPADSLIQCFAAAAKYSKKKIPGQRGATWTAKFTSGLSIADDPLTSYEVGSVHYEDIYCNADGVRGSGKRVMRRYPVLFAGWAAKVEIMIIDPIITQDIFLEMGEIAGKFIGIGRWRPQNGGQNGRFALTDVKWTDNRKFEDMVKVKRAA